jgi:hypothetical protein
MAALPSVLVSAIEEIVSLSDLVKASEEDTDFQPKQTSSPEPRASLLPSALGPSEAK